MNARDTILDEAEGLFAERGFSATSVRQIAEAADVNPAMIHYYFGNKEALLRTVLEEAIAPLAATVEAMKSAGEVAPEFIASQLMTLIAAHPRLPYLVVREVMLPGGVMRDHFVEHLSSRLGGALPGLLAREQKAGRVRTDLPAEEAAMVIMSLAIFPFIVRPVAEQVLDIELGGDALEAFKTHIAEFVRRGFSP